jgi:hypothetical protein
MRKYIPILFAFIIIYPVCANADLLQGTIAVRIPSNPAGGCISVDSDSISMHLRKVIVEKDSGLFTADNTVGLIIKTTVRGVSGSKAAESIFPRMFKTSVKTFSDGQIVLPFEVKIFQDVALADTNMKETKSSVELEFTLIKTRGTANFGVGLEQLAEVSKSVPPLPEPYSNGFKLFTSLANGIIQNSLNRANNVDEVLPEGQLSLSFAPASAACTEDHEKMGSIALIKQAPANKTENEGYVDIAKDYCWDTKFKPFEVKFSEKPTSGSCSGITTFKSIKNTYYALVLVSYSTPSGGGSAGPSIDPQVLKAEAYGVCDKHGISKENCF